MNDKVRRSGKHGGILLCVVFALSPSPCRFAPAEAAPNTQVVCTLPVLKAITEAVGGEDVEVVALAKPNQDPHGVSPTPSLMKRLREADLFIEVGMQLEVWADLVADGSGNPRVVRGGKGRVVASAGVPREDVPQVVSRSEGDVHPEGNPHVWLDPLRAKMLADNIAARLKEAAPARAAGIDTRLKEFRDRVDDAMFGAELVREVGGRTLTRKGLDGTLAAWIEDKGLDGKVGGWLRKARPLRGRKAVEFHRTWVYFAKEFGIEIVGSIQPKPGIEPGPRHLEDLRALIPAQGIRLILVDPFYDLAHPRALADDTGARMVVLPSQPGGGEATESYVAFMEGVIERVLEAAQ